MNKNNFTPIDPTTEVTRYDIARLAQVSTTKIVLITQIEKYGFPAPHRKGPKGILLYLREAVETWLANNDIQKIVITAADRGFEKKEEPEITSADYAKITIGLRPKNFAAFGKSVRVHVPERNDYEPPIAALTRYSNKNVEFSSLPSFLSGAFE
jgi:hypothetical protein